jgi:hypothetical protein
MKHYRFLKKEIEPAAVVSLICEFLTENGFRVDSEDSRPGWWDLHVSKRGGLRIAVGAVRDADVVVAGARGDFEVQFRLGVWGRDLAVPLVEGIATAGIATAVNLHEEHLLEETLWRDLIRHIDPALQICDVCGSVLESLTDLQTHRALEAERSEAMAKIWDRIFAQSTRMS